MKFNFKKIVPVLTGAILLGSTIGFAASVAGASATYPTSFSDSVVVIGSASADSAPANDIAKDLGKLSTSSVSASVSDGWLAKKGSNELHLGGDLESIDSELDSSDLPTLLADQTFKDNKGENKEDYDTEETITFTNTADVMGFETPSKGDNKDVRGSYLKLYKDEGSLPAFTYKIEFPTGVKYDNSTADKLSEDFELTKIHMLGMDWTVTGASGTSNHPTKLTLMGGAASSTMASGEKKDLVMDGKTYSVQTTVYDDKVQFVVNGETLTVDNDSTDELSDGTVIGVTDISVSSKESVPDQATFYIGARKLVLENGEKVNLNDEDVDHTKVTVHTTSADKTLDYIQIAVSPDEDTWIGAGQSWTEPVFGALKMVFSGLDKKTEDIVFSGGSSASLTFDNYRGKELKLPLTNNESDVFLGDGSMDHAIIKSLGVNASVDNGGNMVAANNDFCLVGHGYDLEDCEGLQLLVTDTSGEARIIELSDFNLDGSKLTFKDGTQEKEVSFTNTTGQTLDLGYTTIVVAISQTLNDTTYTGDSQGALDASWIKFTTLNQHKALTSLEGQWTYNASGADVLFGLYNSTTDGGGLLGTFKAHYDTTDEEIQATSVFAGQMNDEADNTDWQTGIDAANYGALVRYDSDGKKDLSIQYPEEKVVANVYVAPVSAIVSGAGIVPVVKDAELGAYKTSKNLVVVGGPAINSVAAELMGLTFPTYGADAGFVADQAMITLYEGKLTPGKVALLVAGYEAKDTAAAAKALIAEKKTGTLKTTTAVGAYLA